MRGVTETEQRLIYRFLSRSRYSLRRAHSVVVPILKANGIEFAERKEYNDIVAYFNWPSEWVEYPVVTEAWLTSEFEMRARQLPPDWWRFAEPFSDLEQWQLRRINVFVP